MELFYFLDFAIRSFYDQFLFSLNIDSVVVTLDFIGNLGPNMFGNILPVAESKFLDSF